MLYGDGFTMRGKKGFLDNIGHLLAGRENDTWGARQRILSIFTRETSLLVVWPSLTLLPWTVAYKK
jgi:tryptophanase